MVGRGVQYRNQPKRAKAFLFFFCGHEIFSLGEFFEIAHRERQGTEQKNIDEYRCDTGN